MHDTATFGGRLRYARLKWGLSQGQLAEKAGVGIATIQRAEQDTFDPRLSTAQRLADALSIRVGWLLTNEDEIAALHQLTVDQQHVEQSGPGTDGLPGYVVIPGGVWYEDDDGEWQVEQAARATAGTH